MLKGLLWVENEKLQMKQENYEMGKLTVKGKHIVREGRQPHTNVSKPVIMRGGRYKCRITNAFETKRSAT